MNEQEFTTALMEQLTKATKRYEVELEAIGRLKASERVTKITITETRKLLKQLGHVTSVYADIAAGGGVLRAGLSRSLTTPTTLEASSTWTVGGV